MAKRSSKHPFARFQKRRPKTRSAPPKHHSHSHAPATPKPAAAQSHAPVYAEGILQLKGNFGFVLSEDPKVGDVLVQGPSLRLALAEDRVRARLTSSPDEPRRSGEIVEVLERARQNVVGIFKRLGNLAVLAPDENAPSIRIVDLKGLTPKVGELAVARITEWPTPNQPAAGVLTEVLGFPGAEGVDRQGVIRKYDLPNAFEPMVETQAKAFGEEVSDSAWQGRETFFHQRVFTIDGADAKDFDDAVSLERVPHGWRLGVHIADVAHYVREGTALDKEAYRRGTSVYLTGTVLPMLPFALSDNLCSLRPDCVRLTLSCVMDIDLQGHILSQRIFESAIRSVKRFTYDEVETILYGDNPPDVSPDIIADVRAMGKLAQLMRRKRFARGSLDFDFPEPDVTTDLQGKPIDIQKRDRLEAHRLIEDFMLLANEAVATHMRDVPFLYRIHEMPDPGKLEKLRASLETLGIPVPRHTNLTHPLALQKILASTQGTPLQPVVHLMILRSLKQAVYSPDNRGHFGLASKCYTHFTSPIRRYPDLVVHRMIKERLHGLYREDHWKKELSIIARHTSRRERVAVDAEREYLDIQKVRLMEKHLGGTFTGVISGVTNFGIFIQLNEFFVEGLVHVTQLGHDYFVYDEVRMQLRGRRTNKVFSIGQEVTIQLAAANAAKHQLDFKLLESKTSATAGHKHRKGKSR